MCPHVQIEPLCDSHIIDQLYFNQTLKNEKKTINLIFKGKKVWTLHKRKHINVK